MAVVERRLLGMVESVFAVANALGGFRTVRGVLLDGTIDAETLRAAVRRVSEVLPLLRARIERSWRGTEFVVGDRLDVLPLEIHDRFGDEHWQWAAESELHRPREASDPLWRLLYLRPASGQGPSELVLTMHHAICDGTAGPSLVHLLLTACAELTEGRPALAGMQQPLSIAADRLLTDRSQALRVWRFSETLLRSAMPSRRPRLFRTCDETPVKSTSRRTEIEFDQWDEDLSAEFVARCREERTSVHGALCAGMLAASRPLMEAGDRAYSCYSNVNLRPFCVPPVDPRQFGCFVYWIQTRHRFDDAARFWDLARECGDAVQTTFKREGFPPAIVPGTARAFRLGTHLAMRQTSRNGYSGRTDSVGVSNLGVMRLEPRYGPFEVLESQAATSQHLIGVCAGMLAHTFRGRMFFSLPYATGVLDRDAARRLLGRFYRGMRAAVGGQATVGISAFERSSSRGAWITR